jgi:hypothetical protein
MVFDYFDEIRKIIELAKQDLFFIDPYLDSEFVSRYLSHVDPSRDEWQTKILPLLKTIPVAALMRVSGRSRSMLVRAMAGRSRPRRRNQQLLKSILHRLGLV